MHKQFLPGWALAVGVSAVLLTVTAGCNFHYETSGGVVRNAKGEVTSSGGITMKVDDKEIKVGDAPKNLDAVLQKSVTVISSPSGDTNPVRRVIETSVPVAAIRTVDIRTNFGDITALPAVDPKTITVHTEITLAESRLSDAERKRYIVGFKTVADTTNGVLKIRSVPPVDYPKNIGWGATFRVGVSTNPELRLTTSNGAILVKGTRSIGVVSAHSDFGNIQIIDAGTSVDAKTSNGTILVTESKPVSSVVARSDFGSVTVGAAAKNIEARSSNGSIGVSSAPNASKIVAKSDFGDVTVKFGAGEVTATSSNGSVSVNGNFTGVTAKSDFGNVNADLVAVNRLSQATLTSSNGKVTLTVPPKSSLHIKASTENGAITTSGLPITVKGDSFSKSVDALLNGGRTPITLRSDFGDIVLAQR